MLRLVGREKKGGSSMNNIYKKLVAATVATLVFIGTQSGVTFAKEPDAPAFENPDKPVNEEILKETFGKHISNEEKDLLARLVEAEAKGESYEGKVAVAAVVLNRVDSSEFPNNISDVIYEKVGHAYAFSPVQNREIEKPASEEAIKAVKEAITSPDRLNHAIYFYNPDIATDDWIRSRQIVKTIDNHVFAI